MKFDEMEAFVEVVRSQSLRHAADLLNLTQPAITRRLQHFEDALGVELLDRNTKPLRPTPLGRTAFEQCRTIMREIETLRGLFAGDAPIAGVLRLGVAQTVADIAILQSLLDMRETHPDLQVRVSSSWGNLLLQKVEEGELDAAAVVLPAHRTFSDRVLAEALGAFKLAVVAQKGRIERRTYTLAECQAVGWVLNPDGCGFRAALQSALAGQGQILKLNLDVLGTELQLGLVANGLGLGLVPMPSINVSAYATQLEVIQISDFKPEIDVWMVRSRAIGKVQSALTTLSSSMARSFEAASHAAP